MTKAALMLSPFPQFFDSNGLPLSGGTGTFYVTGTTTLKNIYTTSAKSVTLANPLDIGSTGYFVSSSTPVDVYLDGTYKFVLKDSAGVTIRTVDPLTSILQAAGASAKTGNYTVVESDIDTLITVDASSGAITISLTAVATMGAGAKVTIKKIDSSANAVTIDANSAETIDGATTYSLPAQYDSVTIQANAAATAWVINNRHTLNPSLTTLTTSGAATIGGALTVTGALTVNNTANISTSDSRTNTVAYPLTITDQTSGTPASGIGTGLKFQAESADEAPSDFGTIEFGASDVTAGSEDTYLDVLVRVAGAALTAVWRFATTAAFKGIFTHANTADRTYTFPDTDISKHLVQYKYTSDTAVAATTTALPWDDTIPQNTEGAQFMSLSITPKSASNILIIQVAALLSEDTGSEVISGALFQDSTANALAAVGQENGVATSMQIVRLVHHMVAGTTSATTFKFRAGSIGGGTVTFNGSSSARKFGGVAASNMCIYEYSA